jgi:hypothetical protein
MTVPAVAAPISSPCGTRTALLVVWQAAGLDTPFRLLDHRRISRSSRRWKTLSHQPREGVNAWLDIKTSIPIANTTITDYFAFSMVFTIANKAGTSC